jgi:hypothetical protein
MHRPSDKTFKHCYSENINGIATYKTSCSLSNYLNGCQKSRFTYFYYIHLDRVRT